MAVLPSLAVKGCRITGNTEFISKVDYFVAGLTFERSKAFFLKGTIRRS